MINKVLLLLILTAFFTVLSQETGWACTFITQTGTSGTTVTIKIADTYFQIPERYLYTFKAIPAERKGIILPIPHKDYVSLNKKGERGYNCDGNPISSGAKRMAISDSVDFCGKNDEVFFELKNSSSDVAPSTWARDIELANKFHLGKNPCGEEKPLSWDDELVEEDITDNDIKDALSHRNEQIRKAAEAYSRNSKLKD